MAHGKTLEMKEFSRAHPVMDRVPGKARLSDVLKGEYVITPELEKPRDRSMSGKARIRARRAGNYRSRR